MDGRVSTLLTSFLIILVSACAGSSFGENVQGDPVKIGELQAKLAHQRLQRRLGVKEITILGTETYRVLIGTKVAATRFQRPIAAASMTLVFSAH